MSELIEVKPGIIVNLQNVATIKKEHVPNGAYIVVFVFSRKTQCVVGFEKESDRDEFWDKVLLNKNVKK